jgi:carboxyl-terminal processing protease
VGYIQLSGFQKTSTEELQKAIKSLEREGLRYLVLDLRGNPGGLLNVAVEIADRFLENGVIVSTRGRAPGQSYIYRANAEGGWRMPVAVLIDHDSASASEILAGALKDHHRAVVLGERSYGKGSVQSIFPLKSAPAGLKLTTAKFYSPANRPYSEQGVEPDVAVVTRAKPAGPSDPELSAVIGDPERDHVLKSAIQQARRQISKAD